MSHASERAVTVGTVAVDNTANNGSDYNYLVSSVVFSPNQVLLTIPLSITNSGAIESSEDARVDISCTGDCVVGAIGNHTFTITDVP